MKVLQTCCILLWCKNMTFNRFLYGYIWGYSFAGSWCHYIIIFFNASDLYDHDEVNTSTNVANIRKTLNLIESEVRAWKNSNSCCNVKVLYWTHGIP
jgi:hypothetical protein